VEKGGIQALAVSTSQKLSNNGYFKAMTTFRLHYWLGLAGVEDNENARARRWANHFEIPVLLVTLWIPVHWFMEVKGLLTPLQSHMGDWVIWIVFLMETLVLSYLVDNKLLYLRRNWMNLVIVAGGVPMIWSATPLTGVLRSLRLLLLAGLLFRFSAKVRLFLAHNRLGATLAVASVIIVLAGLFMAAIEPAVKTPWDGIWWAWVTVTTVGYGDIVPVTGVGKLFAALLILMGVGLFALMTANFSSFFIGLDVSRVEAELEQDMDKMTHEERDIHSSVNRLGRDMLTLEQRLDLIERREQTATQQKQRMSHDVERAAKEERELLQLMRQVGSSVERIEKRLDALERKNRG
jgi:voltage-gated potassium channel